MKHTILPCLGLGCLISGLGLFWLIPIILTAVATVGAIAAVPILFYMSVSKSFHEQNKYAEENSRPKVLVVDDDFDFSLLVASTLNRIGFEAEVISATESAYQRIGHGNADIILLDWMLEGDMTANDVVQQTNYLIEDFPNLKSKFNQHHPKIVTFSSLESHEVHMLQSQYMFHVDHWHKSMSNGEFEQKARSLMLACA